MFKLLSVTCDNVSVNDKMIEKMAETLTEFPGDANRTRCFDHIINLVAKTMTKCFDSPTKRGREDTSDDAEKKMLKLEGDADWEEEYMESMEKGEELEDDDIEGWLDEEAFLSEDERKTLKRDMLPVRMVLAKVQ